MKRIIKNLLFIVNVIIGSFLIISTIAVYLNPNSFPYFALLGISFPVFLILISLLLFYWIFRKKKKFILFNIMILILTSSFITDFVQINLNKNNTNNTIKFMTFNVRQFDYYNWKENVKLRDKYFEYIKSENPDIVCFQEFFSSESDNLRNVELLTKEVLKTQNMHFYPTHTLYKDRLYGIATFSKYPIINKAEITFEASSNLCIYTDLKINNDTIRVYNNHLQSIKFQPEDYQFMDSLKLEIDSIKIGEAKGIIRKLLTGFEIRAKQADIISKHIANCKYKTIVCGDFNDTPISYTYHKMLGELNDSFVEAGTGIGNTYNGSFPSFRIDYVLYDNSFECEKYLSPRIDLSDHFPVISYLKIKK